MGQTCQHVEYGTSCDEELSNNLKVVGERIQPRYSGVLFHHKENLFVFSGADDSGNFFGDLWKYEINTYKWQYINPYMQVTHSTGVVYNDKLYLYGGFHNSQILEGFYELNMKTLKMSKVSVFTQIDIPIPLYAGKSILFYSIMFIFGGANSNGFEDKIYKLDLDSFEFSFHGNLANKVVNHTAVIYKDKAFVFGGSFVNQQLTNEVREYKLNVKENTLITTKGDVPPPIQLHSSTVYKQFMYIIGGETTLKKNLKSIYKLDIENRVWYLLTPELPFPMKEMQITLLNGLIYFFGGKNFIPLNRLTSLDPRGCQCIDSYSGYHCEIPQCESCNGECTINATCQCNDSYSIHPQCLFYNPKTVCNESISNIGINGTIPLPLHSAKMVHYKNELLLLGGYTNGNVSNLSPYTFNYTHHQWNVKPTSLSEKATFYPEGVFNRYKDSLLSCFGGSETTCYELELESLSWSLFRIVPISFQNFSSSVVYNHSLYVFGGFKDSSFTQDIFKIDLRNINSYGSLNIQLPSRKIFFDTVLYDGKIAISFGGIPINNEIHYWNMSSNSFHFPMVNGVLPPSIYGHSSLLAKNRKMYVIGGFLSSEIINTQIYSLDILSMTWKTLPFNLKPRHQMATEIVLDHQIYIFGGQISNITQNDMVLLELKNCSCGGSHLSSDCSFSCFGEHFLSKKACSNHGTCVDYNQCECFEGYYGLNCSLPICYEYSSDHPQVCHSHGTCNEKDKCSCDSQYLGQDCSFFEEGSICSDIHLMDYSNVAKPNISNLVISTVYHNNIYVFGLNMYGPFMREFWMFNLLSKSWKQVPTSNSIKFKKGGIASNRDLIYFFGNRIVYSLNLNTNRFKTESTNGPTPHSLYFASIQKDVRMFIFGGINTNTIHNLNLETLTWENRLSNLTNHTHHLSASLYNESIAILFGGFNDEPSNMVAYYYIDSDVIVVQQTSGEIPPLYDHDAVQYNQYMYIIGGLSNNNVKNNHLYKYDALNREFSIMTMNTTKNFSSSTFVSWKDSIFSIEHSPLVSMLEINLQHCDCKNQYVGPTCSNFHCFSVLNNDSLVCHGHGNCITPDKCVCTEDFDVQQQCQCRSGFSLSNGQCKRNANPILFLTSSSYTLFTDLSHTIYVNYIYPIRDNSAHLQYQLFSIDSANRKRELPLNTFEFSPSSSLSPQVKIPKLSMNSQLSYNIRISVVSNDLSITYASVTFLIRPKQRLPFGGSFSTAELFPSCPFYNFTFSNFQLEDRSPSLLQYTLEFSTEYASDLYCPLLDPSVIQFIPLYFGSIFVRGSIINKDDPSAVTSIETPINHIPEGSCNINSNILEEAKNSFINLQSTSSYYCRFQYFIIKMFNESTAIEIDSSFESSYMPTFSSYVNNSTLLSSKCQSLKAFSNIQLYFKNRSDSSYPPEIPFQFLVTSLSKLTSSIVASNSSCLSFCTFKSLINLYFYQFEYFLKSSIDSSFDNFYPSSNSATLLPEQQFSYWMNTLSNLILLYNSNTKNDTSSCSFGFPYLSNPSLIDDPMVLSFSLFDFSYSQELLDWSSWNASIYSSFFFIHSTPKDLFSIPISLKNISLMGTNQQFKCVLFNTKTLEHDESEKYCSFKSNSCSCDFSSIKKERASTQNPMFVLFVSSNLPSNSLFNLFYLFFLLLLLPACVLCLSCVLCLICGIFLFRFKRRRSRNYIFNDHDPDLLSHPDFDCLTKLNEYPRKMNEYPRNLNEENSFTNEEFPQIRHIKSH